MKISFLYFQTGKEAWSEEALRLYEKKLKPFAPFEIRAIKSKSSPRDQSDIKKQKDGELLLEIIDSTAALILFDEGGREFKDSLDFADHLSKLLESGKSRIYFVIGSPYGFSGAVKARATQTWSLSRLTMNHHVALVTALEQIYRGFTIRKNIPYHNS